MPTYVMADAEVTGLLRDVIKQHHDDLVRAGVTVSCLMAHAKRNKNGDPVGPALKLWSFPAAAIVKINSLKDRVEGKADATVFVDADAWPDRSDAEKWALFSHELTHLLVVREKDGVIKLDDADRPKLKMRPHDFQCGVFYDVMERFGPDSLDAKTALDFTRQLTQRAFSWWMGD